MPPRSNTSAGAGRAPIRTSIPAPPASTPPSPASCRRRAWSGWTATRWCPSPRRASRSGISGQCHLERPGRPAGGPVPERGGVPGRHRVPERGGGAGDSPGGAHRRRPAGRLHRQGEAAAQVLRGHRRGGGGADRGLQSAGRRPWRKRGRNNRDLLPTEVPSITIAGQNTAPMRRTWTCGAWPDGRGHPGPEVHGEPVLPEPAGE